MTSVAATKSCTKCKVEKPIAAFAKRVGAKDGHRGVCRECQNLAFANDRERAKLRPKVAVLVKKCRTCKIEKPADQFAKDLSRRDGLQFICTECRSAYHRANRDFINPRKRENTAKWNAANPDRLKAANARYRAANPERFAEIHRVAETRRNTRKANLPTFVISEKDRRRLLSSPCAIDGCLNADIEIDHVIPISRGGSHGRGNFQSLCASHNRSKGAKFWIEFRVYLASRATAAA